MTIDAPVLMLFASCAFVACSLVIAGFWYQHRTWTERYNDQQRTWAERYNDQQRVWAERYSDLQRMWAERCDIIREMAPALGELHAYKNQQIMHHRGKTETGFFLFRRTIEKNLFLEYRDGKLSRAIGDTDDLSVFPDLSAEDIAAIRQLLGAVITGAGAIAAGGSASLMN